MWSYCFLNVVVNVFLFLRVVVNVDLLISWKFDLNGFFLVLVFFVVMFLGVVFLVVMFLVVVGEDCVVKVGGYVEL